MARQNINIGTIANDGTGDDLRTAMQKVNDNFVEVYAGTLSATTLEFTANNILSTGTNNPIVFIPNGTGTIDFPAIRIDDNNIKGLRSNEDLRIIPNGTGGIKLDASTDITGALGVTGLATLGSLKFGSGSTITSILDEDTMTSDSATAVPTQQSVKAYVDAQIVSSNSLRVADDSSTVVTIDLDGTLSVIGATGITTSVSGSTLTITGTAQDFAFSSLTGKPTTLSGYGITDAVASGSTAVTIVGDDSTGTAVNVGETFKIAGGTNITTAVSGDILTITGSTSITANSISSADSSAIQINDGVNISGILSANTIDTNVISSGDSSAITVNDNLNVSGNLTANSIIGEVVSVGSSGSPVITNQTIDLSVTRFVEVYVNADVTLDFQNPQNGTIKRLVMINTGATIRNITYQIDSVTQDTKPIGDGSTTNTKQLYELYSFETQKLIASYEVLG